MKIKQLHLSNFRHLKNYKINFDDKLTVLVANNGAGKTAILDAITIALGPFIGVFPSATNKAFKISDVRVIKRKIDGVYSSEKMYPVELTAVFSDIEGSSVQQRLIAKNEITIARQLSSDKSKTTIKDAIQLRDYARKLLQAVKYGDSCILPVISYYGTSRLLLKTKYTQRIATESNKSRTFAYHDCLYPESNYKEFEQWFIYLQNSIINELINAVTLGHQDIENIYKNKANRLMLLVENAISKALECVGKYRLFYSPNNNSLMVDIADNDGIALEINSLSDGIKNILALVADIAYRCTKLNPQLQNPLTESNGIVLIDEIEMHLHPSWQQLIVQDLCTIFPNIQFIITTHSPHVLSTIKKDNIRIIDPAQDEALLPSTSPYAKESVVALEDIMQVKTRPANLQEVKDLEKYLALIANGDINNVALTQLRSNLDKIFGADYEQLLIADILISKHKALKHD